MLPVMSTDFSMNVRCTKGSAAWHKARRLGHSTRLILGIRPLERHRILRITHGVPWHCFADLQRLKCLRISRWSLMVHDVVCMCKHLSHLIVPYARLGDDVGESAEVWREVEIEDIMMEGFVQESYFLGIIFWSLVLLGLCHLLFGVRRYPHEREVTRSRNLNSQDRSTCRVRYLGRFR
jgi:hypothetical protein